MQAVSDPARPKAFVSHATEDKDRFVLAFAEALRAEGVDAWLDVWEMQPGDSLVDKIFTEGIGEAGAVIVVISNLSLDRRWVKEELDAAVVQRINTNSRLIPIVLDGLEVSDLPVAIRHLVHVPVTDAEAPVAARRIAQLLFGGSSRPPLGPVPPFADSEVDQVPGLNLIDSTILKAIGDEADRDFGEHFDTKSFAEELRKLDVDQDTLVDSLEVLDHDGLIKLHRTLAAGLEGMHSFQITLLGLDQYFTTFLPNYSAAADEVCAAVVNLGEGSDEQITETVGHSRLLVLHVLRVLDNNGTLHLSEAMGGSAFFHGVSPKLRRLLMD